MKYVTTQWVTYDEDTGRSTKHPWYLAEGKLGGRLVERKMYHGNQVPSYLGIAYEDFARATYAMYPKPLHLIVRYYHKLRWFYWLLLRAFYWIGLIDIARNEMFSWKDFFRIKNKI